MAFDFRTMRAELFIAENLRDCHANIPLCAHAGFPVALATAMHNYDANVPLSADAALRAMLRANVAVYAGSTAGVFWKRFFALGSG